MPPTTRMRWSSIWNATAFSRPLRTCVDAPGTAPHGTRASRRRGRVPRKQERVRDPHGALQRSGAGLRRTTAPQEPDPGQARRRAPLHPAGPQHTGPVAQVPDRRRCQLPRQCQRHHPQLRVRYLQRVPGLDRRAGRRADRHGPARAPGWTTANCV